MACRQHFGGDLTAGQKLCNVILDRQYLGGAPATVAASAALSPVLSMASATRSWTWPPAMRVMPGVAWKAA
jgi:hypothetical protein